MKVLISILLISLVNGFSVRPSSSNPLSTSRVQQEQLRTPLHMVGAADEYQNALKQAQKEMMMNADMPVRHFCFVLFSFFLNIFCREKNPLFLLVFRFFARFFFAMSSFSTCVFLVRSLEAHLFFYYRSLAMTFVSLLFRYLV